MEFFEVGNQSPSLFTQFEAIQENGEPIRVENLPPNWYAAISPTIYDPQNFIPLRKILISFPISVEMMADLTAYMPVDAPAELKTLILEQLSRILDTTLTGIVANNYPHMVDGLTQSLAKVQITRNENPDVVDLTNATTEEVADAFKKLTPEDEIEVVGAGDFS